MPAKRHLLLILLLTLLLSACAGSAAPALSPTVPPTEAPAPTLAPTATLAPSPTPEPSLEPTLVPTDTPAPTPTLLPFAGFGDLFRFYRAWHNGDGSTTFFFIHAGPQYYPIYALANETPMVCEADVKDNSHMSCLAQAEMMGMDKIVIQFFADEARQQLLGEKTVATTLPADTVVWHNQYNCPLRGQDVECESEYRNYDGVCYYAHTCRDACGPYYSSDNIPPGIQGDWVPSGPCN